MNMDDGNTDDDFLSRLEIVVDGETRRRLIAIADECHSSPKMVAASILRDVLIDDAIAHAELNESDEIVTLN
jgi:hypothetical protein